MLSIPRREAPALTDFQKHITLLPLYHRTCTTCCPRQAALRCHGSCRRAQGSLTCCRGCGKRRDARLRLCDPSWACIYMAGPSLLRHRTMPLPARGVTVFTNCTLSVSIVPQSILAHALRYPLNILAAVRGSSSASDCFRIESAWCFVHLKRLNTLHPVGKLAVAIVTSSMVSHC